MTQAELGQLADPFVEQTLKVCKRTLDQARIGVRDIDQVLLVGGSTLIARVRQRAAEFFAHEPAGGVSPFEAVAVGAAIQAYAMTDALDDDAGVPTAAALTAARSVASLRVQPAAAPPPFVPNVTTVPTDTSPRSMPLSPRFTIEKPTAPREPRTRIGWLVAALLVVGIVVAWLLAR